MKVPFITKEFSRSKNIAHWFNIVNMKGDEGIGYDMIIGCDIIVQFLPKENFSRQLLEWDETVAPIKDMGRFLGQP